jgi:hypothetical protein
MFINLNLVYFWFFRTTSYVFSSAAVDQKDIQETQNDFCKFFMWEALYKNGCFFDKSLEYVKDPKYKALRASTQMSFTSKLTWSTMLLVCKLKCPKNSL